ncbi:transglutaminase family protein [Vitreimonas sp.]|uniref:transglutaminase family protein n=1 Tax=Vitreimonas sp. TaxID=3069702 RepID=UPI002ED77ABC
MRLSVRHVTRYEYDPPAMRADLRLRLFPSRFDGQKPLHWTVTVNGDEVRPLFVNAFGDEEAIWRSDRQQTQIEIVADGVVETSDAAGVMRGLKDYSRPAVFLRETRLTAPSREILELARASAAGSVLDTLHELSQNVRNAVEYEQNTTHHATTATEALQSGKGVCQDHAHVFIAAARLADIPARYVAGYISAGYVGRQESHAWAEAYVPDLGWVGFDPSNRQSPTDAYVRICCGLDAADAAPLRGWVSASVRETLAVEVDVAPSPHQAQQ